MHVTTGRIMDVIGSDLRYMTSLQLITRFLNTYYKDLVEKYLNRDFGDDYMFQLEITELVIESTSYFYFKKLNQVLVDEQLEPIGEVLDQNFKELF